MNKISKIAVAVAIAMSLAACDKVPAGNVGEGLSSRIVQGC